MRLSRGLHIARRSREAALILLLGTEMRAETKGESIEPLPLSVPSDAGLVALGEKLFADKRLSENQTQSCASCHDLAFGAINRLDVAGLTTGKFNTPTLFNVGFHFRYFWNGRATTLEEQIELTIYSPTVFNNTWPKILARLETDASYQPLVERIQPKRSMDAALIMKSIAAFERSLVTPNSRFDRFLRGDTAALDEEEKRGFRVFRNLGCNSCHQGMLLGGNMFQKYGIFSVETNSKPAFPERDFGRFSVTQREADRYVFKVPSLRNIELTAPYLHDGSAQTLEGAVTIMGRSQLGRNLSHDEIAAIVRFLKTLTGEWRGRPLP